MFRMVSNIVCNVKFSFVYNYNVCFIRVWFFFVCVFLCIISYVIFEYLEFYFRMWFSLLIILGKMFNLWFEDCCLVNGWSVVFGIILFFNFYYINIVGFL